MNEKTYTGLSQALKIAEAALKFYELRVVETEATLAVHKDHVTVTQKRIAGLKEALEAHR